jgi:hypothetical protein
MIIIKRLFSAESSRRLFSDILKENSGTILALGAIGSGSFGIGFYVNQMRVFEEKLNAVKMEAKKDCILVKMEAKKDSIIAEERARKDVMVAEERARKDVMVAEEKFKKDVMVAEERSKKEALQLLYNIFTQEEYKDAKKKMMAQKDKIVNIE